MNTSVIFANASHDFAGALNRWRVWAFWAQHELNQRYRRSFLGPLWISLTMGFHILVMGLVWGLLFNVPYERYLPYVALGLILWTLLAGILSEGANCFISMQAKITEVAYPLPVYFFQMAYRNALNFGHNIFVFVIIAIFFGIAPSWQILLAPIALFVMIAGVGWIALILGVVSTRYRDIPVLVQSLLVVLMFLTPVMYQVETLRHARLIADLNPFYHLIEILREPLLGGHATLENWVVSIVFAVVGWVIAFLIYGRYRSRITYWL